MNNKTTLLLEVKNLKKHYPGAHKTTMRAVDGISFFLKKGETLGLVGESGCGKSTAGRAVLRLVEPTSGEVIYKGRDLLRLPPGEMRALRKEAQIIFQDPYSSLNPKITIDRILAEPFRIHNIGTKADRKDRVVELLKRVGLSSEHIGRYPHEFSGGQRQRIGVARAVALNPEFIVADEPVSALDVSIRAQILNLLRDLQDSMGIAYLFISHDMGVVEYFCDRVAVMYLGKFVEVADRATLYAAPRHPYTQALLAAIPAMQTGKPKERLIIKGDVPAIVPSGCAFHTRCPIKEPQCATTVPDLKETTPGHLVACHLRS
jgi:oligopeptide/dipeptide ABC transporter ATP-binding protein